MVVGDLRPREIFAVLASKRSMPTTSSDIIRLAPSSAVAFPATNRLYTRDENLSSEIVLWLSRIRVLPLARPDGHASTTAIYWHAPKNIHTMFTNSLDIRAKM